LLKVRLARESLLKKSKNVTKKCMLKKSERCINFFVCRNWYMQIAFLVCVAAAHLPFSLFLCSRYRFFLSKWCVAALHLCFFSFCQLRHMVLRPKWCVGEGVKVSGCEGAKDKVQMADGEWCWTNDEEWWRMMKGCIELYGWGWKKGLETWG
jgi:hypothetical protein